jgi:hypothetical protein
MDQIGVKTEILRLKQLSGKTVNIRKRIFIFRNEIRIQPIKAYSELYVLGLRVPYSKISGSLLQFYKRTGNFYLHPLDSRSTIQIGSGTEGKETGGAPADSRPPASLYGGTITKEGQNTIPTTKR